MREFEGVDISVGISIFIEHTGVKVNDKRNSSLASPL